MIDDDTPPIDDDVPPIPPPAAMVCRACADLAGHQAPDGVVLIYCEHFQTGAYFSPRRGHWRLFSPITREKFEAEILRVISRYSSKKAMN